MRPQAIESKGTIPAISLAFLCIIYLVQAATKIDQISSHQVLPEVDSSSIENSVPREIEETLVKRPAGDTIRGKYNGSSFSISIPLVILLVCHTQT